MTILGAGESGTGAALLAKAKGYDVFVSDNGVIANKYKAQLRDAEIEFEEKQHSKKKILESQLVIKSPGIPDKAPLIIALKENGVRVIDEIEFAFTYTKAKIIAITGTNGKTTTTLLTYHLLKEAGFNVGLAGNIGKSLALQVVEDNYDYYVVEISSFQLDGCYLFKPHVAILLNITPDHMDRYEYKLDNYVSSKFRIIQNADANDHFIYFGDNDLIANRLENLVIDSSTINISLNTANDYHFDGENMHLINGVIVAQKDTVLLGAHNAINMMAAINAALTVEADIDKIKQGLKTFNNAPHRMEYVDTINEVRFINDSKATNVDAVKYALDSFSEPLVWIAGGVDKGNEYDLIMEQVNAKVKSLICLGNDNTKLREAFHNSILQILETDSMKDAVRGALSYAAAHDVVLLSPACASFDLYKNYEDRGEQFKQAVKELKNEYQSKASNQ